MITSKQKLHFLSTIISYRFVVSVIVIVYDNGNILISTGYVFLRTVSKYCNFPLVSSSVKKKYDLIRLMLYKIHLIKSSCYEIL